MESESINSFLRYFMYNTNDIEFYVHNDLSFSLQSLHAEYAAFLKTVP